MDEDLLSKSAYPCGKLNKTTIIRRARFNAAHRLFNPQWEFEKNEAVFGKCNNPNYHGHNYELYVSLTGYVDPDTGFVYDLHDLADIIDEEIIERFDHKNLNLDLEVFKNLNPTAENIAVVIWNLLRKRIDNQLELKVKLCETENNIAEYGG